MYPMCHMLRLLSACLSLIFLLGLNLVHAQTTTSSGNALFILDGSGSMWGKVEGKHKIVIAKEVMTQLVQELPDNIQAGLQVYGHRSKGDCNDIELLVPLGADNRQALLDQIKAINPRGKTPITQAFQHAAEQLRALEEETSIVLVSDGKETCTGDPCTLVRELRDQGIRIRVHVVGFDVDQDEREQLVCIAEAGGGQYFSADNAMQLQQALTAVREQVIALVDENRCQQYATTAVAQQQRNIENNCALQGALWAGDYTSYFDGCRALPAAEEEQLIQASNARQSALENCQQQQQVQQHQCQEYAALAVDHEQQNLANECGFEGERWQSDTHHHINWCLDNAAEQNLLAAEHIARKNALAQCLAQIAKTQTEEKEKVSTVTGIRLQAVLSDGEEPLDKDLYYRVFEGKADLDGQRKQLDTSGSAMPLFKLPAGTYRVTVKHGATLASADITLTDGELIEQTLNLNAGYLRLASIPTEGMEPLKEGLYYQVYAAQADLQGKREKIDSSGSSTPLFKLPAGSYFVTVKHGSAIASAEFEVKAGELNEQTLNLNVGYLRLSSIPAEAAEALDSNLYYRVYNAKKDLQGQRKQIDSSGSAQALFKLPAGRYFITVKHGVATAAAEFEVKAGQLSEQVLNLNAGYLRLLSVLNEDGVALEKNVYYQVYEAKTDLQGKRKQIESASSAQPLFRLPMGFYHITARYQDHTAAADIEIKPGELTEHTLVLAEQ